MESWTAKLMAVFSLFAVVIIFGLLPVKFLRLASHRPSPEGSAEVSLVDWLSCFAGGVFLATTMIHLLPDVRRDYEEAVAEACLPVPELLVCVGYFVVLLFEHAVLELRAFMRKNNGSETKQEARRFIPTSDISSGSGYGTVSESGFEEPALTVGEENLGDSTKSSRSESTGSHVKDAVTDDASSPESHPRRHDNNVPSLHGDDVHILRSLVFLIALSTHTVFEGLALGLQSSAEHVLTLLGAVLIHKAIISFTVGVRFAESYRSVRLAVISLVVLAAMAPLGVVVGIAVSEFRWSTNGGSGADLVRVGMQGFATGTFLYVTFFEVLPEQLKDRWSLAKALTVVLGFSAIVLLEFYVATKHH